jgi:arsenite-transporting ATPase
VLLFTGKGGVGKTTTAAATAIRAAASGRKTLVMSTDAAHSLGDACGVALGSEPTEITGGLYGQQINTQERFERSWRELQDYLVSVLDAAGVDPLQAEELTVLPGAEEVLALLEVRNQISSGRWDAVIVDCAPTAETLRLLALPGALSWYLERILPMQRRVVRTLRPVLTRAAGVPMPRERVFDAVVRLHAELRDVHKVLTDARTTSVRLVLTPEALVVAEARRSLTSLALYGYTVDGVVANKVFPDTAGSPWLSGWVSAQSAQLDVVGESFADMPVRRVPYRDREPVGADELAELAAQLYGDADPLEVRDVAPSVDVTRTETGFVLSLAIPLAVREEIDLARRGDDLVVTVESHRRVLTLPSALRRCDVTGAALRDGRLHVEFEPDPALWMSR